MLRARPRRRSSLRLSRLVRRGRELPALALVCVWLFGSLITPVVHLALHGGLPAHAHRPHPDRAACEVTDAGRCHDGHCHEPSRAAARPEDDGGCDGAAHGRGSLAHGDLAAVFPAPALLLPPFIAVGDRARPAELRAPIDALSPAIARGPPDHC